MQFNTTFRGLTDSESQTAARVLEKQGNRVDRLIDDTSVIRAVIDGDSPTNKVSLFVSVNGEDLNSHSSDYELPIAIADAVTRLRTQMVRHRHRKESLRHR